MRVKCSTECRNEKSGVVLLGGFRIVDLEQKGVRMQDVIKNSAAGQTSNALVIRSDMCNEMKRWASYLPSSPGFFDQNPSEVYLEALRDFISEWKGALEGHWQVEFAYSPSRCKTFAIYCAPDGSTFDSMLKVAQYLGLLPSASNTSTEEAFGLLTPRSFRELKNRARGRCNGGPIAVELEPVTDASGEPQAKLDDFPLQYEDLFIISAGRIDPHPSFHSPDQIWPIGYKSIWHDKITGSLFTFEVLDGGDSSPVFRVRRAPCTKEPIPNSLTLLKREKSGQADEMHKKESKDYSAYMLTEDEDIGTTIAEHDPPQMDVDVLSISRKRKSIGFIEGGPFQESSSGITSVNLGGGDFLGEFSEDGDAPASVWVKVIDTLLHACRKAYAGTGSFQFCCTHKNDVQNCNGPELNSLSKFCYSTGPFNSIPDLIRSEIELDASCEVLSKWLKEDRFGLDVDFVQELIEQLPGVSACSKYRNLKERFCGSTLQTIGSGSLRAKRKSDSSALGESEPFGSTKIIKRPRLPGKPLRSILPSYLIGDVLQVYQFLWRFSRPLGLEIPLSLYKLELELLKPWLGFLEPGNSDVVEGYGRNPLELNSTNGDLSNVSITEHGRWAGELLGNAQAQLLKVLIREVLLKVPIVGVEEFKSENRKKDMEEFESEDRKKDMEESESEDRKEDMDVSVTEKNSKLDVLPINDLTWPELARRYILSVLSMENNLDSSNGTRCQVIHCLHGDGGSLCGCLVGLAARKADAVLFAEASKRIFGSVKIENEVFSTEWKESDLGDASKVITVIENDVPEWAQLLEPVRKLRTNVGARIKRCINEALEKNPPEWAEKMLVHSISKEVYKGNASGPTKRAVISVLEKVKSENLLKKAGTKEKYKKVITLADLVMKQCRMVLRDVAALDKGRILFNLIRSGLKLDGNDDEGLVGYPIMVSCRLDFRTIDLKLAAGAYGTSNEAFFEDVQEFLHNIRTTYGERPGLIDLVASISQKFEKLYEEEVLTLVNWIVESANPAISNDERKRRLNDTLASISGKSLPKAPWEDGVCKPCGIDKDNGRVLLCDTCDSMYHTYCLQPPLSQIPEGIWYCPSCVVYESAIRRDIPCGSRLIIQYGKGGLRTDFTQNMLEKLAKMADTMELKEYWELATEERVFLLKFLSDEALRSGIIRDHLEECASRSSELQQKLDSFASELESLKLREVILDANLAKERSSSCKKRAEMAEGFASSLLDDDKLLGHLTDRSINTLPSFSSNAEDLSKCSKPTKQSSSFLQCTAGRSYCSSSHMQNDYGGNFLNSVGCDNESVGQQDAAGARQLEVDSLKNEISNLEDLIAALESELTEASVRTDFLGKDSAGRLYWALGSRVVVNGIWIARVGKWRDRVVDSTEKYLAYSGSSSLGAAYSPMNWTGLSMSEMYASERCSWACFESEAEIEELLRWLREDDAKERDLKDTIKKWQRNKPIESSDAILSCGNFVDSNFPVTKAVISLGRKLSNTSEMRDCTGNLGNEGSMHRCDCLELVVPSRVHCKSCHHSFYTGEDLEGHGQSKCNVLEEGSSMGKRIMNAETLTERSLTQSSFKEKTNDVGHIGSNGSLLVLQQLPPGFTHSVLSPCTTKINEVNSCDPPLKLNKYYSKNSSELLGVEKSHIICQSSLKPLVGQNSRIFRQLKINLLDMDLALPEEVMRPSRVNLERRRAWRAFVKSAQSIYEMVQATFVLEDMIKTECLRNGWWYRSSPSAAAKISTVSGLALLIYSLDAAIIYEGRLEDMD